MRNACAARLVVAAALASLPPLNARAQEAGGIALNQLDPAPAGDPFLGVPSPAASGRLTPRALVAFDYAHRPLTLPEGALVGAQGFLHVGASLAIRDRLLISALLPVALLQDGDSPSLRGETAPSPTSAELGDLRLGARVRLLGEDGGPVQLGVAANVHLPTGPSGSYAGEGALRLAPQLLLGGRLDLGVPLVWSAMGGAMIRASDNPSALAYGAGVAVLLFQERLQVGPEVFAATPLRDGSIQVTERRAIPTGTTTNAELLLGARVRVLGPLVLGAAGGPGLTEAIGTPAFRLAGSLAWAPEPEREAEAEGGRPADVDEDGILGAADACPYAHGPAGREPERNGCPIIDDDEDGIPTRDDACPDRHGPASPDPKSHGCPASVTMPRPETPQVVSPGGE